MPMPVAIIMFMVPMSPEAVEEGCDVECNDSGIADVVGARNVAGGVGTGAGGVGVVVDAGCVGRGKETTTARATPLPIGSHCPTGGGTESFSPAVCGTVAGSGTPEPTLVAANGWSVVAARTAWVPRSIAR